MSRKIIIALAAVSLSLAALAPSTASAARFGGGGHGGGHFGARGHVGGHFGGHFGGRYGNHFGRVGRWDHRGGTRWGWNHRGWRFGYRYGWRPGYVAPGYVAPNYAAAPTTGNCSCLTKQYTPEGNVLFQDMCTKESALAPGQNAQNNQNPQQ